MWKMPTFLECTEKAVGSILAKLKACFLKIKFFRISTWKTSSHPIFELQRCFWNTRLVIQYRLMIQEMGEKNEFQFTSFDDSDGLKSKFSLLISSIKIALLSIILIVNIPKIDTEIDFFSFFYNFIFLVVVQVHFGKFFMGGEQNFFCGPLRLSWPLLSSTIPRMLNWEFL